MELILREVSCGESYLYVQAIRGMKHTIAIVTDDGHHGGGCCLSLRRFARYLLYLNFGVKRMVE